MGIHGLTTFVDSLDKVFSNQKLRDCNLLIDGYGVLHFLNYKLQIPCEFGGNYNDLYFCLDQFLNSLKACKICAYFIFDGARDPNESKSLKRAKQRLNSINARKNGSIQQVLPICSYMILVELLKVHEIKYYQCNFEADYEIAVLANNLFKCPVLSNDSDYYIYNLKYGYIPIDKLDFELNTDENDGGNYMISKLYKIEVFCQKFKIETPCIMPIFAVLCGTDTVDSSVFRSFMISFINENNNQISKANKLNYLKKNFNLYSRILKWLAQSNDVENCITRILKFIKKELHGEISALIRKSIDNYCYLKNEKVFVDIDYVANMLMDTIGKYCLDRENDFVKAYQIERNFIEKYNRFKFSRLCNDLLLYKSVIYSCQIEIIDWPSTYLSATKIRKLFYELMFNKYYKKSETSNEKFIVKEYLRQGNNLKIFDVEIELTASRVSTFDGHLSIFRQIFPDSIVDPLFAFEGLNDEIKVYFLVLFYWLNSSNASANQWQNFKNLNSIRTFIVSFMKYSIIDVLNDQSKSIDLTSSEGDKSFKIFQDKFQKYDNFLHYIQNSNLNSTNNNCYLKEISKKLNEYQITDKKVNLKYIHFMCEFQAIYQSVSLVNEFLESEMKFDLIGLYKFFNGSFLYNFNLELNSRVNSDLFIEELFSRKSVFSSLFNFLFDCFIKIFNINNVDTRKTVCKNTNIESNLKDNKIKCETHEVLEHEETVSREKFVDKNNKYSYLSED